MLMIQERKEQYFFPGDSVSDFTSQELKLLSLPILPSAFSLSPPSWVENNFLHEDKLNATMQKSKTKYTNPLPPDLAYNMTNPMWKSDLSIWEQESVILLPLLVLYSCQLYQDEVWRYPGPSSCSFTPGVAHKHLFFNKKKYLYISRILNSLQSSSVYLLSGFLKRNCVFIQYLT